MKLYLQLIILFIFSGIIISGVSGTTVSMTPVTLSPGNSGTMDLTLDSAPSGISGYQMTVTSDNSAVATITGATFPSWASLSEAVSGEGGAYALRAIDLNSGIEAGASQIALATISLQATGAGTAHITIQGLQIDDDSGNAVQAEKRGGEITVTGGVSVTPTPLPSPAPSSQEITVGLNTGWNLINIPMQPSPGFGTAEVFKNVQSAGHSILAYDGAQGWITIGKNDSLIPMTGYWIYSTSPVTIPLTTTGTPTGAKPLVTGWNLAGITGTSPKSAGSALSSLSSWTYVVTYDSSSQQYRDAAIKGTSDTSTILTPGEGFWIYLDSPGTLIPGA